MQDILEHQCAEQIRVTLDSSSHRFCVDQMGINGNQFYAVTQF
jgi:hypothetical protein